MPPVKQTQDGTLPDSAVPGLAGAQVQVSLNLYHTYALDMVRATVNLHVWVRSLGRPPPLVGPE